MPEVAANYGFASPSSAEDGKKSSAEDDKKSADQSSWSDRACVLVNKTMATMAAIKTTVVAR